MDVRIEPEKECVFLARVTHVSQLRTLICTNEFEIVPSMSHIYFASGNVACLNGNEVLLKSNLDITLSSGMAAYITFEGFRRTVRVDVGNQAARVALTNSKGNLTSEWGNPWRIGNYKPKNLWHDEVMFPYKDHNARPGVRIRLLGDVSRHERVDIEQAMLELPILK